MKAGSTGRRGNPNSSSILPHPKPNCIASGRELTAGRSARTSPRRPKPGLDNAEPCRASGGSPARPPAHGCHSPRGKQRAGPGPHPLCQPRPRAAGPSTDRRPGPAQKRPVAEAAPAAGPGPGRHRLPPAPHSPSCPWPSAGRQPPPRPVAPGPG